MEQNPWAAELAQVFENMLQWEWEYQREGDLKS